MTWEKELDAVRRALVEKEVRQNVIVDERDRWKTEVSLLCIDCVNTGMQLHTVAHSSRTENSFAPTRQRIPNSTALRASTTLAAGSGTSGSPQAQS